MGFLLALFIVPAFVMVGVDGYRNFTGSTETVAVVAGFQIKKDRWDAAHKQDVDRIRATNPSVDARTLDTDAFKYASLERLVREQLLGTFVEKHHVTVGDQRLALELQQDQFIASLRKSDGSIDIDRYKEALLRQGMTPVAYEQTVRRDVAKSQVLQVVQLSGVQTPTTAKMAIDPFFEQREVQVLQFQPNTYQATIKPTQADVEKFYSDNQNLFKVAEQVDIEYLLLDLPSVTDSVKINEDELKAYYDQNAARYSTPEERKARHILLAVDAKASAADKETARKQAQSLLAQINANPKVFPDLAKKHSQDPGSASNGGDLGFFQKGAMVKPFEEAAFNLKQGGVSDIVETEFGFHIIQVVEIKTSTQRSFESVKVQLEADLKKQQSQRVFAEKAESFGNLVYEQADALTPVAEKLKLKLQTVKGLARQPVQGSVPDALRQEKFLSEVFSSSAISSKQNTSAIEIGPNQLIAARVLAHRPATTSPLAEVQQQVEQRWIAAEAQRLARVDGEKTLEVLKTQTGNTKLGAAFLVSRRDPKTLPNKALITALSVNPTQLPQAVGVDLGVQGYVVIQVNKVIKREPPPSTVAQQEIQQYEQWWSSAEASAYYQALKRQFKVDIKVQKPKDGSDKSPT